METNDFTKKKKIIAGIIGVGVFAIILAVGIFTYRWQDKQKQKEHLKSEITAIQENFTDTKEHTDKLNILETLTKEYKEYKASEKADSEIVQKYEKAIESMKQYFLKEYEKTISENTISDVGTIDDKEILRTAITNLQNLEQMIANEAEIVCDETTANNYKSEIEALISSYESRIAELEQQEIQNAEATADTETATQETPKKNKQNNNTNDVGDTGNTSNGEPENVTSNAAASSSKPAPTRPIYTDKSQMDQSREIILFEGYYFYFPQEIWEAARNDGVGTLNLGMLTWSGGDPLASVFWIRPDETAICYYIYCDGTIADIKIL